MKKKDYYDALSEAGVSLRPIGTYKLEELREMYETLPAPPALDALEKHDADSAVEEEDVLPEDESYPPCYLRTDPPEEPEPEDEVEIHTLFFVGGGWCNELGTSYAPGYYRPKTAAEYLALRQYANKEL